MCGIVGLTGKDAIDHVSVMSDLINHRGPDDYGFYEDRKAAVSLGMRRLSIIDLEGGHQPMGSPDGRVWIVFNGEIYNSPQLRSSLEEKGHEFISNNSDTEVLLHLYLDRGREMLGSINGMFSFVIYDRDNKLLFGARDRLGIKPLYYWIGSGRFAFSSELKSILKLPFVNREINMQSLYHYMSLLYVPGESSIIKNVSRLPPGCQFVFNLESKNIEVKSYWRPSFDRQENRKVEEWAELIRDELRESVRRWTLSDVPIALSLSGGIDSSAIAGLLAEIGGRKISTYSLGFRSEEDRPLSEIELARKVAQKYDTDHHEIFLEPDDLLNDLVDMVWSLDEPYGGGLPSWYIFKMMSEDVKVGLTGTGGDELFGNYGKYRQFELDFYSRNALALRRWSKTGVDAAASALGPISSFADRLPSSWRWIGKGRFLSKTPMMLRSPFGNNYCSVNGCFSDPEKRNKVFNDKFFGVEDTGAYLQNEYDSIGAQEMRNGLAVVDMRNQLSEEFLLMTDRFSMAHGLEARTPFLDHNFVELAFTIPPSIRTKPSRDGLKYLLKLAVGDLLPKEILSARKKGFVIPVEQWLRGKLRPLVDRLLNPQRLAKQGIFQPQFYEYYVLPYLNGNCAHTMQIWAALMFQLWHMVFIENNEMERPSFSWRDLR